MQSWNEYYPRPQLRRDSFLSLNGVWKLNGSDITLPFPPESQAAEYRGQLSELMSYERTFDLPKGFCQGNQRVILHFGAVDQVCHVYVNNQLVIKHEGGYLPFSADITDYLCLGDNQLRVEAEDTLSHDYPYGKQRKDRGGMWYTPVSGIWQSVWLEAVAKKYIKQIKITPDTKGVTINVTADEEKCNVMVSGKTFEIVANTDARIDVEQPHLWSPEDPYLYDMHITAGEDEVDSYFALREVSIREVNGVQRVCLNGKPIFMNGLLDQGYFVEGIYLPMSPDAYAQDIENMQELGFNLLRKHIKIEPEIFYYECDRRGMLVMQDMVNAGDYKFFRDTVMPTAGFKWWPDWRPGDKARKAFFEKHCRETLAHLYNHPCIIAYTIFNEGWGQYDSDRIYTELKQIDPTRFYDSTSGWFHKKKSDVDSLHIYFRNAVLRPKKRPMLLSECGGYKRGIEGHVFAQGGDYGYGKTDSEEALTEKIAEMYHIMVLPAIEKGLCGVIYTQVSDVEDEINGLYTFDRAICKVNKEKMRALGRQVMEMITK
ncbi:MAG: glycoside hydrolase family 2 [Clostridia bacterium]|nr:glycoside hydrolase family 2 [Clostridia bacterium]